VLAWTVLVLVFPAALWLWALVGHLVRRTRSDLAASPTQGASEAQREQTHGRASAEGLPVLAVECRGVATRLRRRRVALDPGRSAAALAAPAHRVAVAREAVPMAKEPAAQH
jgi:cell division protein FtsN